MNYITVEKIIITILLINTMNCSVFNNTIYQPTVTQGNYLSQKDLMKIRTGMKKDLILSILGTPILHDLFESNTHYYIYYKIFKHKKSTQKTLILKFDTQDTLISIDHKIY